MKERKNYWLGTYENRAFKHFSGRKLFGCEVCWTCRWFGFESMMCDNDLASYEICMPNINRFVIINPELYRCLFWEEKNEGTIRKT